MPHSLIPPLVSMVASAFSKLNLPAVEVLSGKVTHTDLIWQAPPLACKVTFKGTPLHEWLQPRSVIRDEAAFDAWLTETLRALRHHPLKAITKKGFMGLSGVANASAEVRRLMFSVPEGFPYNCGSYTAAVFCLEAAEVLKFAVGIRDIVISEDDHYVVTSAGLIVGVKAGFPTHGYADYDTPLEGIVSELREMPRGDAFQGCDYDLISKCRSVLHDHKKDLRDFEALDYALQALRLMSEGKHLPALQEAVSKMKVNEVRDQAALRALRDCCSLWECHAYSDRQKFSAIKALLVPHVLSKAEFKELVYNYGASIPATMRQETSGRIAFNINALRKQEENNFAE
jgi:hypothetical protein